MFLKINCFKALIKKAWSGVGLTVGNGGRRLNSMEGIKISPGQCMDDKESESSNH